MEKETGMGKDYVHCPTFAKYLLVMVDSGEPLSPQLPNLIIRPLFTGYQWHRFVPGLWPWPELTESRMDIYSKLSQSASSALENLGLNFTDASHEFLELGDVNICSSQCTPCGKSNRDTEKQHW